MDLETVRNRNGRKFGEPYLNVFYTKKWASAWLRFFCFYLQSRKSGAIDDVIRVCFTDMSNQSKFLIDTNLGEFMNECLVRKFSDNNVGENSEENNQLFTFVMGFLPYLIKDKDAYPKSSRLLTKDLLKYLNVMEDKKQTITLFNMKYNI